MNIVITCTTLVIFEIKIPTYLLIEEEETCDNYIFVLLCFMLLELESLE